VTAGPKTHPSADFNARQRDRLLALATLVFAGSLIAGARGLEDSLLSDAVGAGGVPQGVGIVMGLAAVALFGKSFLSAGSKPGAAAVATTEAPSQAPTDADANPAEPWQAAAGRTAGLVAILVAYGLLLPWLGYTLTVALLVLTSGWLAGAPLKPPLLLCAVAAGPLLWALFDWALRVRMPVGSLWS
jgi:putative tricarboxylic transport membrane protein